MIAVIKGDIIASRKIDNPEKWLKPLKAVLNKWGKTPQNWELAWGDSFQLEVAEPEKALFIALSIKACIRKIRPKEQSKKRSVIDVRMSVGIGKKDYTGKRVSESNGQAFVNAGVKFDKLRSEKVNLAVKSPWQEFDDEINLYLKLSGVIMDNWSVSSAELVEIVLNNPKATQQKIGRLLGIKQNSVSGRRNRSKVDEIMEVEKAYREKLILRMKKQL